MNLIMTRAGVEIGTDAAAWCRADQRERERVWGLLGSWQTPHTRQDW